MMIIITLTLYYVPTQCWTAAPYKQGDTIMIMSQAGDPVAPTHPVKSFRMPAGSLGVHGVWAGSRIYKTQEIFLSF